MKDGYKLMGFQYELTGSLYSLGQIPKCKVAMLDHLKPGHRLLIAGVGHGTEAVEAARRGVDVTAVDISKTMLKYMQKKIDRVRLDKPIRMINNDILEEHHPQEFDMVMANYFLNVFSREKMLKILTHLTTFVKPGGAMVIGDFTLPREGGKCYKAFQTAYWYIAATIYWATADNAIHPIYDYPVLLKSLGFEIEEIKNLRMLGMNCHWSILGRKKAAEKSVSSPAHGPGTAA
ncbi:MAG: class I SAM-dependent methyltransferase [Desulfomonilia bacterium]|jgi:demethylmenaquinone methyltransferase/2-methoxy-6-polyprenyl-1,4-benzoquinol methylase|nr:class I SAM-dependent methyltransferase [Deltaproteobacteria bacterium]MDX9760980.1 class I SAM-dependent methyltransferase [Desulfomonilia bacterium]HPW67849.1 class I SAM-dependent methyltransferase [Deltaproteobacteria bacterium]